MSGWFDRRGYTWKEYWIDGRGDGFMKLSLLLVVTGFLLGFISLILK